MIKKPNQTFNFQSEFKEKNEIFRQYLKSKEKAIKSKFFTGNSQNNQSKSWILVFVLMMGIVSLGSYSLNQNKEKNIQSTNIKNQGVAGVYEDKSQNIITGDSFSLVLTQKTPKGFDLQVKKSVANKITGKNSTVTSFLAKQNKGGQELQTGIEGWVNEYDNKMDKTIFEDFVLSKLGGEYEIKSRDINLPKDIKITKLESKNGNKDLVYYVTVTNENYYIFKLYNQTSKYPELNEQSRFTDTFLQGLYLN